jgi:hypothetical protein
MSNPFKDYLDIKATNWSSLKLMHTSPLCYRYYQDNPMPDKAAYALGRAVHCAVLEPSRFESDVVVFDGHRAGKKWTEFKEANGDCEIVKPSEMQLIKTMRDAVLSHPVASLHLQGGIAETNLEWVDVPTQLKCKGRADYITDRRVIDLKTARDVDPWKFSGAIASYLYHGQMAFYGDGAVLHGHDVDLPPLIVAVQSSPPFDVAVYEIGAEALEAGRNLYRGLLDMLKGCMDSGHWSGCAPEVVDVMLPRWAAGMDEDEGTDGMDWSTVATTNEP